MVFQQHRGRKDEQPVGFADKVVGFPATVGKPNGIRKGWPGRCFGVAIPVAGGDGTSLKKIEGAITFRCSRPLSIVPLSF
jgi:hypothetical protein